MENVQASTKNVLFDITVLVDDLGVTRFEADVYPFADDSIVRSPEFQAGLREYLQDTANTVLLPPAPRGTLAEVHCAFWGGESPEPVCRLLQNDGVGLLSDAAVEDLVSVVVPVVTASIAHATASVLPPPVVEG